MPNDASAERAPLSIGQLYDLVDESLEMVFGGRAYWVEAEISKLSTSNGHCYLDLIDPKDRGPRPAVLGGKCWKNQWSSIQRALGAAGITLASGMTVRVRGTVDLYRPQGKFGFVVTELDVTALLGALAVERAELIAALRRDGSIGANAALGAPVLPLRIGLVASPGTEGCTDFLGQLDRSGFAFSVVLAPTTVQGDRAPAALRRSIDQLLRLPEPVDCIVLARGGGAKTDLAAFDDEALARRIATCPIPVWTGIGHSGDESICDLVAGRAHITPTACGVAIVDQVAAFATSVAMSAAAIERRATATVAEVEALTEKATTQLQALAYGAISRAHQRLATRCDQLVRAARRQCDAAERSLTTAVRLASSSTTETQLRRGFAIVRDVSGAIVKDPLAVAIGAELTTTFATGTITSTVTGRSTPEERTHHGAS